MPRRPKIPGVQPTTDAPTGDAGQAAESETSGDDLAEFADGAELPQVDPVQAQLAQLQAEVNRLKRRGNAEPVKPAANQPEMSEDDAQRELAKQVAKGIRPRAILTPSGWMTHQEMARSPASLSVQKA